MTPRLPPLRPKPWSIWRRHSPRPPRKREILRDPQRNYNMMTLVELGDLTPHFSWPDYFKQIGAPAVSKVDVAQPDAMKAVDAALHRLTRRLEDLSALAPDSQRRSNTLRKVRRRKFRFFSRQLTGTTENLPRWRRCVQATDGELGEALGQIYVSNISRPKPKPRRSSSFTT